MLGTGLLRTRWAAELLVDQTIIQLLRGLGLDCSSGQGEVRSNVAIKCSETGLKISAARSSHGLSAHLFLPRTAFRSFSLSSDSSPEGGGDEAVVICVCLQHLLELFQGELSGSSRSSTVSATFAFSAASDHLAVSFVGSDRCRVTCKLATFDPYLSEELSISPMGGSECKVVFQAEQFGSVFGVEASLKMSDRVTIEAGGSDQEKWLKLQLMDMNSGREQILTFSNSDQHKWWEALGIADSEDRSISCRTDWLCLAAAVSQVADKAAMRWLPLRMIEVQLLTGGLAGGQPAFLHYRALALVGDPCSLLD